MDISLVIMAAGIGSRYGGGVKQIEPVGPNSEIIIDYSIHDAVKAGFNKIVFIIRRDIYNDFMEVIGTRIGEKLSAFGVKTAIVFQEPGDMPEGRTKPWGTGQAVLSCKGVVDGPFAVINADDYYGSEAYAKAYAFLKAMHGTDKYGMMGYILGNTLSDNGCVTRGICTTDENGRLIGIDETKNIVKTVSGAEANGKELPLDALVSMNFWMLPAEYIDILEAGFPVFKTGMTNPLKDEYLLPTINDSLLKSGKCTIDVIPTDDCWFGVTYKEDKPAVVAEFKKLYAAGRYCEDDLYADMA